MTLDKPQQQRALFATAHFEHLAGSELCIVEMAEALAARGWACDLTAFDIGKPMRGIGAAAGLTYRPKPRELRPLDYDLVWIFTQIGAVMDWSQGARDRTLIAFAHLDLNWDFAAPGPCLEELIADKFLFSSLEAASHFSLPASRTHVFHNAAPPGFNRPKGQPRTQLRRAALVSNHLPDELRDAADALRSRNIEVIHYGRDGDIRQHRIKPADLDRADVVVSIGKTVQYALVARVPVYVYDHLGGPGFLTGDNFEQAAFSNFSGRCCRRVLSGEQIADEIITGFEVAAIAAAERAAGVLQRFRLNGQIDALLAALPGAMTAEARMGLMRNTALPLAREKALASAAGHFFGAMKRAERRLGELEAARANRPAGG